MKSMLSRVLALIALFNVALVTSFTRSPGFTNVQLYNGVANTKSLARPSTSLNVFGNKKSKAAKEAEEARAAMYWAGDWVCKDCGYIYNRAECADMYFEEQGPGFRCPQCSGPRRRYAKKVGDVVGTTLDGGDAPILIFSFGGVIATIAFGIWAVNNL